MFKIVIRKDYVNFYIYLLLNFKKNKYMGYSWLEKKIVIVEKDIFFIRYMFKLL